MAINVSVGNNKVSVGEGRHEEPGAAGEGLVERIKETFRDAASKVAGSASAAIAAGTSSGGGSGASVHTSSVNGKTHVVITRGTKTMERDFDHAVKVSVAGQDPAVVTITDTSDNVIEKADF